MFILVLCAMGQNWGIDRISGSVCIGPMQQQRLRSDSIDANNRSELTRILRYKFHNFSLLERALTHRSYGTDNNDTLEFLGDSVLGFIVSDMLYRKNPASPEGELSLKKSKIVNNNEALNSVAQKTNLARFIRVGKSFQKSNKMASMRIQVNALEAIVGAIYLDGGMDCVKEFVYFHFQSLIEEQDNQILVKDHKSQLQEYLQGQKKSLPTYKLVRTEGPPHQPRFIVECKIEGFNESIWGEGNSIKLAEQVAAKNAYALILGND